MLLHEREVALGLRRHAEPEASVRVAARGFVTPSVKAAGEEPAEVNTSSTDERVDMVGCHAAIRDFEFVQAREL